VPKIPASWAISIAVLVALVPDGRADQISELLNKGKDALLMKEDYEQAMSCFNEVLRLDPKNAQGYHWRGVVYQRRGDFAKAIADEKSAIRLDPTEPHFHSGLGWLHAEKGEYAHPGELQ
jgi:Flp pilus assembly protein TadD